LFDLLKQTDYDKVPERQRDHKPFLARIDLGRHRLTRRIVSCIYRAMR